MADRRMFSKQVIDSDAFLDMPLSTQALYFHLGMRADDDGFVNNARKIMRMIGSSDDEMKVLITKKFVLLFESGVIVIKHWRLHNYIQKDRYKETTYIKEKSELKLKDNNVYSLETECIQFGDTGKVSIDKVRKEKISIEKTIEKQVLPTSDEVRSLFIGYLSNLNITDINEERTDGQIRAFIRHYIGDSDVKGVWVTAKKKFIPKSCVKNWIDKNPGIYRNYKKAEQIISNFSHESKYKMAFDYIRANKDTWDNCDRQIWKKTIVSMLCRIENRDIFPEVSKLENLRQITDPDVYINSVIESVLSKDNEVK